MRINIITRFNGVGLEADYLLLHDYLSSKGHQVRGIDFTSYGGAQKADLNIWEEILEPMGILGKLAPENWCIVNPEWFFPAWLENEGKQVSKFICKTHDAFRLFEPTGKAIYTGWMAKDRMVRGIRRERRFLHIAGKSNFKGTKAIELAWNEHMPPLTIIGETANPRPGIELIPRLEESCLIDLMNRCQFHLCPSMYEGWGHHLHEGLSCGAVILTTDAPPMNEFGCAVLVEAPEGNRSQHHMATLYGVRPCDIKSGVDKMMEMSEGEVLEHRWFARKRYEDNEREFEELFPL
jgi:hypothetical protein